MQVRFSTTRSNHMRHTIAALSLVAAGTSFSSAQERTNPFGDPFVRVTSGIPGCPVPRGPELSAEEVRAESHWRAERGTSCYQSGRCRLPNAYLYDKEIIPRVRQYILQSGQFDNTSVWVYGQRRWVFIEGCVATEEQGAALERAVRNVDDVEAVIPEWSVLPGPGSRHTH